MQDLVRVGGGVPTNLQLVLNSLHIHVHHYGKVQEVNDLDDPQVKREPHELLLVIGQT